MTPLDDYHHKEPSGRSVDDNRQIYTIGGAIVAILIVGVSLYWFLGRTTEEVEAPLPEVAQAPQDFTVPPRAEAEPEPTPLPALDASDAIVRDLVSALSFNPDLASWLVSDGLIRRFVVTVDNIAEGRNPSSHVPFMRPESNFSVTGDDSNAQIDPRTYRRYDTHAQIIASLDTQGTADLFRSLEPLLDEAYVELGYPDTPFRDTLARAVTHLLETPIVTDPPTLIRRATFYEFQDPSLESLTPAQKQFMGLGPDNVRLVQGKLRAIATSLEIGPP